MKNAAFRSALVVGLLLTGAAPRWAFAGSNAFGENKRVTVSTTPASPTLVSAAGTTWQKTTLINSTTYWCLLGDNRTVFSTSSSTGTARLINREFSPDGPSAPYTGAVYAVCENVAAILEIIRMK